MSCFKAENYVVIFLHDKFSFMFLPDVINDFIFIWDYLSTYFALKMQGHPQIRPLT